MKPIRQAQGKQRIVPNLWFDTEAKEAAEFYASVFDNSKITHVTTLKNTPSGDCDVVSFTVLGQPFMAISAGPLFKLNPAISFFVNFDPSQDPKATERIDEIWEQLAEGGEIRMPIQEYPFSKRYGWVEDKFGVNWQLILTDPKGLPAAPGTAQAGDERPLLIPSLLFVNEKYGKAEEALRLYVDVFKGAPMQENDTKLGTLAQYESGQGPNKAGTLMFGEAKLLNTWLTAMDGALEHKFDFNEAVSLMVLCDTQEQIDYFWDRLSAVPESDLPAPRPDRFYVYVILCDDDSMYIGQTQDIAKRWRQHEAGQAAGHTKRHRADRIIHFEEFSSRGDAVKREHDLKTGFGRKWLKREFQAGRTRQAGQCGWLKDKFGVSWQITSTAMDEMMASGDQAAIDRVTQAFLPMKKFVIADLEKAYAGNE